MGVGVWVCVCVCVCSSSRECSDPNLRWSPHPLLDALYSLNIPFVCVLFVCVLSSLLTRVCKSLLQVCSVCLFVFCFNLSDFICDHFVGFEQILTFLFFDFFPNNIQIYNVP